MSLVSATQTTEAEGWVRVTVTAGAVDANLIVRQQVASQPDREGAVRLTDPAVSGLMVPFDNRDGYSTEVSVVNTTAASVGVRLRYLDGNGVELAHEDTNLDALARRVIRVSDAALGVVLGSLEVTVPGAVSPLTGTALRRSLTGPFTSLPVVPLRR